MERKKEEIDIVNSFLYEVNTLHPTEYSIGEKILELIKEKLRHMKYKLACY